MLSDRERNLVHILRERPSSGSELAGELGVSRRTVVRDVARATAFLEQVGAGRIVSGQNYQLEIESTEKLDTLLRDVVSDEDRVLLLLLTTPRPSVSQLSEDAFASSAMMRRIISSLNKEYGRILRIETRTGQGISVEFSRSTPADLLAALVVSNPSLEAELELLSNRASMSLQLCSSQIMSYVQDVSPSITERQAHVQALAAAACSKGQDDNLEPVRAATKALEGFLQEKRDLHYWLFSHRQTVVGLIEDLLLQYGIRSSRSDLSSIIFDHVVRCAMFPTLVSGEMRDQMRELRAEHPFEFDFGHDLSAKLFEGNTGIYVEPDFLALYVVSSVGGALNENVTLLMLGTRQSISLINRSLIEQAIGNVVVRLSYDLADAEHTYQEQGFDITVRDDSIDVEGGVIPWNLVSRGVLSEGELSTLKELALKVSYRKGMRDLLPEDNFVRLDIETDDYWGTLDCALSELVGRGCMSEHERWLITHREMQGERLEFGGVAFPHSTTITPSDSFRLFAILPRGVVYDGPEAIRLIIMVLASKSQTDKSSIFTYFYSLFGPSSKMGLPIDIDGYDQVIAVLSR